MHFSIVLMKFSRGFFLQLFGILAKVRHLGVFSLEFLNARLFLNEALLPTVQHVDNCKLLWVGPDLTFFH